jgi:hypothetical protein
MTVSPIRRAGPLMSEVGVSGISRQGGIIADEILPELTGPKRTRIIRQMLSNDATIGALLFAVKMLVRQVEWRVDPAADTPEDKDAADFISGALFDDMSHSWSDLLSDIVSFLPWGWAYHEIVYKYRDGENADPSRRSKFTDGKIGWRKWPIRAQETLWEWVIDPDGGIRAMKQVAAPDFQTRTIPIEKALLFRTESNRGNPEGYSLLRNAYRPWRMKTRIENIEGIGVERDLAGLPVAWVPPDYMDDNAPEAKKAVFEAMKTLATGIKRDEEEGVVMPTLYDEHGNKLFDLTLLSTGGQRQFDTNAIIGRYDQRILMSVMADFLMLGAEKVGSFALSSDKTNLFAVALGAWLDEIADVVNSHAIPRLLRLNGMTPDDPPKLCHADIETPDLTELADYVQKLTGSGVLTPDATLEDYLRQAANLPELPEETANAYQPAPNVQDAAGQQPAGAGDQPPAPTGGAPDGQG